jgi:hypothetical protein
MRFQPGDECWIGLISENWKFNVAVSAFLWSRSVTPYSSQGESFR